MAHMNAIKVLLLEDEAALAEIVCESLQSKGFIVQLAPTIAKARSIYLSFKPAILLLDIMLPDGNGFDFASDIRKKDIQTPIIFLTSRSRIEDVVHAGAGSVCAHRGAGDRRERTRPAASPQG